MAAQGPAGQPLAERATDPRIQELLGALNQLGISSRTAARGASRGRGTSGIDLIVAADQAPAARGALRGLGFARLPGSVDAAGALHVGYHQPTGEWIEVWLSGEGAGGLSATMGPGRSTDRLRGLLARRGLGVALLGPDGAGKSTLAAAVREGFYFPVETVYMGLYQSASSRRRSRLRPPGVGLTGALGRQFGRWLSSQRSQARGRLVLFDRYTYDALLPTDQPLSRAGRLRRMLLAHACPPPDLVVILDASGALLYERKGEHDPALLERHRQRYLELGRTLPGSIVVDAGRDAESVAREVIAQIWRGYARRWT